MSLKTQSNIKNLQSKDLAILGIPFDANSSFLKGPSQAPQTIREQLHCGSANYFTEHGTNLETENHLKDVGDISFSKEKRWFDAIYETSSEILEKDARVLSLGGDHSVTWPIIRAYAQKFQPLTLLQIDAHPDLYNDLDGNKASHACPFARIMEEGLVTRLVQIGIRTLNEHQREQAEQFGVEIIEMKDWSINKLPSFDTPLYLSLDLDGLDPAYAPGVSHHEPGGFSTREVLNIIQTLNPVLVGADVVELNPSRDPVGMTAMLAAKLMKELAEKILQSEI